MSAKKKWNLLLQRRMVELSVVGCMQSYAKTGLYQPMRTDCGEKFCKLVVKKKFIYSIIKIK